MTVAFFLGYAAGLILCGLGYLFMRLHYANLRKARQIKQANDIAGQVRHWSDIERLGAWVLTVTDVMKKDSPGKADEGAYVKLPDDSWIQLYLVDGEPYS